MNELLKLLKSFVGKELTAENIQKATEIVEGVKVKLNEKDAEIKTLQDEIKPFKESAEAEKLKEAFTKAGGHESQFDKAKKYGLTEENVKDIVKDFPTLAKESKVPNLSKITEVKPSSGGSGGQSEDEGSLVVRPDMTFNEN